MKPSALSGTVFVVEPDAIRRTQLETLLRTQGCAVISSACAEEALAAMKHDWADVILSNAILPDMTGLLFVQRIRAYHERLPVILVGSPTEPRPDAAAHTHLLPAGASEETIAAAVTRCLPAPPAHPKAQWPASVLVVDDEPKLRILLENFLQLHGLRTMTAGSGREALEALKTFDATIVLLDIKMPDMNGVEALKHIKALKPHTTVLMVTGVEEEEIMQEALALGAYDYLVKPFDLDYLETVLLGKVLLGTER
jgi:DNA-binding NtrC family response regulator